MKGTFSGSLESSLCTSLTVASYTIYKIVDSVKNNKSTWKLCIKYNGFKYRLRLLRYVVTTV
jgi:hypothetical protein